MKKHLSWIGVSFLVVLFVLGCIHLTETKQIKRDLIGHTMGGREQAWYFANVDQIKSLKVEQRSNSLVWVDMILHDKRVKPSYHAKALLTYNDGRLEMVSLLSIKQIHTP